jgi:small subunit ribosomal protein S9
MAKKKDEETAPETPAAEEATTAAEETEQPSPAAEAGETEAVEGEAPEAESVATEPVSEAAEAEEPKQAQPEEAQPEATQPEATQPEATESDEAKPEEAEPGAAEAEPTETHAPAPAAEAEPVRALIELAADARYSATGKRKSAVARVILLPGSGAFLLNGKPLDSYFPRKTLQEVVRQPLKVTGYLDRVDIRARIHGGGISSQADAVRHGIAKALIEADPNLRGDLKRRQLLTRDPRVKERRKAGLKKARKRPQFSKR